jgi:ornithine carbamoyltransferase
MNTPLNTPSAIEPVRHFLDLMDHDAQTLRHILDGAARLKKKYVKGQPLMERPLAGKVLGMVFDRPSTRTRISFDLAMRGLGGETLMLTGQEMQLGRGESISDTARVLSRYVDAIMIRVLDHDDLLELAKYAHVPVLNGLTKRSHPCQIMADILTFEEHRGSIQGRTLAWCGDYNNVLISLMHASAKFGFQLNIATPDEFSPPAAVIERMRKVGANVQLTRDPHAAVEGVDCVITDCWVSMGDEEEARHRQNLLKPYQVNAKLMSRAHKEALFMHCLPAHRGEEVSDEVIDGSQSVVFDEAENRLHAQKGILAWCFHADTVGGN